MAKIDWKDAEGTAASVERVDGRGGPMFTVVFTYKVDDEWYGGTFTGNEEYREGDFVAVRYDPLHPEINDLVQQEARKRWITIAVIAVAIAAWLYFVVIR